MYVGGWGRGRVAGCFVALALLFAGWPVALALLLAGVMTGDAYLSHRLGGFGGGVRSLSCSCPLVLVL